MAHLGEFSTVEDDLDFTTEPDLFGFHGVTFELPSALSQLPLLRFASDIRRLGAYEKQIADRLGRARPGTEQHTAVLGEQQECQVAQLAAIYEFLCAMLPGPQWEQFSEVANAHGSDVDELFSVATRIYSEVVARPGRRSSGSPAGPSTPEAGSAAGSGSTPEVVLTPAQEQRLQLAQQMVPVTSAVGAR